MDLKDIAISHDDYSIVEVISALQKADDLYHNGEESPITDAQYDGLRRYAQKLDPTNKYFTGTGSEVRGGKIPLPFTMGSLDQLYEGDVAKWVNQNDLRDELLVVTDKLDGISCMLIYDENGLRIAYSRGDGEMGADITRHLRHMPIPSEFMHIMDHPTYTIRAEIILSVEKFKRLQNTPLSASAQRRAVKSRSGKAYKNPRNMVAGLMNSKKIDPELLAQLSVVAYEIVSPHHFSKKEQLSRLWKAGFSVAPHVAVKGRQAAKEEWLIAHLNTQRNDSMYEIDGVVIDVNSTIKRQSMNPTRDTLNPTFARKYKVADESNVAIATVVEVQWNTSKHGYLKPRVRIEPVELVGVTVQHATGFNAKFINENNIGPGAKIKITRSGDVIPFIMEVIEGTEPQLPSDIDMKWTETGVDLVLVDHESNEDVLFEQIVDFFASIEAPHMRSGNLRKFYDAGYDTITKIIKMNEHEMAGIVGTNGHKIYKGLKEQLTNIPLWKLMGSYPCFGRGVGRRKFKKLYKALGAGGLWELASTCSRVEWIIDQIVPVDGFEKKTAEKIANGMQNFWEFYNDVYDYVTILEEEETMSSSGTMNDQKVVFTGFRDKDLAEAVEKAGGTIQSGVSGKTTILVTKNPDSNSGKVKKARDKGVRIVGIDEFKGML